MDKHIGITVSKQSLCVGKLYSTKPKVTSFDQLMYVVSKADAEHFFFGFTVFRLCVFFWKPRTASFYLLPRLKRSLMPSMSKAREKRIVWSSGLLFAVAMT